MLEERIRELFRSYDSDVQAVILGVLRLEQAYISYERPRLREEIDDVIERVAKKEQ